METKNIQAKGEENRSVLFRAWTRTQMDAFAIVEDYVLCTLCFTHSHILLSSSILCTPLSFSFSFFCSLSLMRCSMASSSGRVHSRVLVGAQVTREASGTHGM
jgi:hypothetical protein